MRSLTSQNVFENKNVSNSDQKKNSVKKTVNFDMKGAQPTSIYDIKSIPEAI